MKKRYRRHRTTFLGITLTICGMGLLSYTAFRVPFVHSLWPPALILFGGFLTWRYFFLGMVEFFFFFGMLCVHAGILGLLSGWFSFIDIGRIWPLFLTLTGLTLLPYGYKKRRNNRLALIVPSLSFIFLSLVFLPFSLGVTTLRFREFIFRWWPLLIVFLGILFLVDCFCKNPREKRDEQIKN